MLSGSFTDTCYPSHSKFTNVFGSSRLLGSLALSPPGIRRQDKEGAKVSLAKEREVRFLLVFFNINKGLENVHFLVTCLSILEPICDTACH